MTTQFKFRAAWKCSWINLINDEIFATKLREDNVIIPVCLSVHRVGVPMWPLPMITLARAGHMGPPIQASCTHGVHPIFTTAQPWLRTSGHVQICSIWISLHRDLSGINRKAGGWPSIEKPSCWYFYSADNTSKEKWIISNVKNRISEKNNKALFYLTFHRQCHHC